jgi:hypothetical protein
MTSDKELIDGIDGDALPDRLYNIKGDHRCTKCNRSLKGKIAYLNTNNDLICRDMGSGKTPVEALLCDVFVGINKSMGTYNERIPTATVKKIEKALREALEY